MDPKLIRRVKRLDRLADWVITAGGVFIIVTVLGILVLIANVALPLFSTSQADIRTTFDAGETAGTDVDDVVAVGLGDYEETAFLLHRDGTLRFHAAASGAPLKTVTLASPTGGDAEIDSVDAFGDNDYSIYWRDGGLTVLRVIFRTSFDQAGNRSIVPQAETLGEAPPPAGYPVPRLTVGRFTKDAGLTQVSLLPDGAVLLQKQVIQRSLFGGGTTQDVQTVIETAPAGSVTLIALDTSGETLYAATDAGHLARWDIGDPSDVTLLDNAQAFADGSRITAMGLLLGERTLLVGDDTGRLTAWFPVPLQDGGGGKHLQHVHDLQMHDSAVQEVHSGHQDRLAFSRDAEGDVQASFVTNERHLLRMGGEAPLRMISLNARDEGLIGLDSDGRILVWHLDMPFPQASLKTYFGKIWYESYPAPAYVWQSSAGTDTFEPKLSLMPLIFGTLKGTFYGMLFGAPLAVLAAMYTSHLMQARMRRWIKPAFEIMGAVPTVVVGFLAALWLAPIVHTSLTAFFLMLGVIPLTVVGGAGFMEWLAVRGLLPKGLRGYEFLLMIPVVLVGGYLAFALGGLFDAYVLGTELPAWLFDHLGVRVDQRNSIIIAFALGFAVLPIVYTIADDALTNVPRNLTAASLALGATRWQTVWRVVLPSASPGVFAALMVGFGRAVGETMIVLMATGNTPIMDWSLFNGMRTLSANIAVEIPEAPAGGTLYRTLFLSAVLLFITTFVLNSVAEVVRIRLRRKFGQY